MGYMSERSLERRRTGRSRTGLLQQWIAVAIIAAIRLARELDIGTPSPKVMSVVGESVALAKMILNQIVR